MNNERKMKESDLALPGVKLKSGSAIEESNSYQYGLVKEFSDNPRPLNPPILGDFRIRRPQNWGLAGWFHTRKEKCSNLGA
jgi:hypothetical protein